jgi:hypothetical protein
MKNTSRKWRSPHYGDYGNSTSYLAARIARDRPDILERMKAGHYRSVRSAARDAGIVPTVSADDAQLARLADAWAHADLESRRIFLCLFEDELDAASQGQYLNGHQARHAMRPTIPVANIPDLELLLDSGKTVTEVACLLGVTYRTVCRWRAGKPKPDSRFVDRLREFAAHQPEPPAQRPRGAEEVSMATMNRGEERDVPTRSCRVSVLDDIGDPEAPPGSPGWVKLGEIRDISVLKRLRKVFVGMASNEGVEVGV